MFLHANHTQKSTKGPAATVQAKLAVNQPNDRFEQEADAVAEKVFAGETAIQRKCAECEKEEELQMKPLMQLKADSREGGQEVQPWIQQQIEGSRGSGQSLPNETRSLMESGIGADFQHVNIHTGGDAVQMNRELGAKAFTVGSDIYFNSGQYSPETAEGKKLLAHELTHTVQQGGAKQSIQRAKLDHKQLAWDDFKGAVPKKTKNEATTASDITDPEVKEIKPEEPVVTETEKDCGEGKTTGFSAKIAYDTSKIKAKAYFDEDTSWKKDWTTDATAQESRCQTEVVGPCNTKLAALEKEAGENTKADIKACEKAIEEAGEGSTLEYDCGDKTVEVSNKGECTTKMKDCFDTNNFSGVSWEYEAHTGQKLTATKKSECDTTVLDKCKSSLMPNLSADLLSHEQGHLDITKVVADEIQQNLREKADELETEAEGCTEEEAIKNAKTAHKAKKPGDAFKKIWKDGKKKLKDTQKSYDDETKHSTIAEAQSDWVEKIAAGEI